MGSIIPKLVKPIRRFNVDNRAQRVISKEKPVPAPHHTSMTKQMKAAMEASPNFMEIHNKKNVKLDEHLKSVFVTSTNPQEGYSSTRENPDRPLPQLRECRPELEFSLYEPSKIPKGSCSLQQVMDLLAKHKEDPVKYNISVLAEEYKLDKKNVENLIEYYKIYQILIPKGFKEKEGLEKLVWFDDSLMSVMKQKVIDDK